MLWSLSALLDVERFPARLRSPLLWMQEARDTFISWYQRSGELDPNRWLPDKQKNKQTNKKQTMLIVQWQNDDILLWYGIRIISNDQHCMSCLGWGKQFSSISEKSWKSFLFPTSFAIIQTFCFQIKSGAFAVFPSTSSGTSSETSHPCSPVTQCLVCSIGQMLDDLLFTKHCQRADSPILPSTFPHQPSVQRWHSIVFCLISFSSEVTAR